MTGRGWGRADSVCRCPVGSQSGDRLFSAIAGDQIPALDGVPPTPAFWGVGGGGGRSGDSAAAISVMGGPALEAGPFLWGYAGCIWLWQLGRPGAAYTVLFHPELCLCRNSAGSVVFSCAAGAFRQKQRGLFRCAAIAAHRAGVGLLWSDALLSAAVRARTGAGHSLPRRSYVCGKHRHMYRAG